MQLNSELRREPAEVGGRRRQMGAGVGVSNGWQEYTGLARLPDADKTAMIAAIKSLFAPNP